MKILIISQYWAPENNIPARRWQWLTELLVQAGHEVTVIAPPPHYQRKMSVREWWANRKFRSAVEPCGGEAGETVVRSAFFPSGASLTQRALNQAVVGLGAIWTAFRRPGVLRGYQPDLVIGTVPAIPTAAATLLIARRFRVPYIIDLRDAWPDLLEQADGWNRARGKPSIRERVLRMGPLQVLSALTRAMLNTVMRGAAAIMVTSSFLADDLAQRKQLQRRGSTPPIFTVRNVFPVRTEYRRPKSWQHKGDSLNVLYAGTMGRAQNLSNALKAVKIARDRGADVNLTFVGSGVARDALMEEAKQLDIPVKFEARHPADDLAPYYEWADTALVHLTDWEPLQRAVPSKTYELMAVGIHISAVVAGETAELVSSLDAGDVVEPEDPHALAQQWSILASDRSLLRVPVTGAEWVKTERSDVAPDRLLKLVEGTVH